MKFASPIPKIEVHIGRGLGIRTKAERLMKLCLCLLLEGDATRATFQWEAVDSVLWT